jgi:hypothetical protein
MFGQLEELKARRTNVESGVTLGPRMVFSGPILDGPKPVWPGSIAVGTPEEGRKAVGTIQQGGADFVKVYSLLPREAYFAIAEEAKKRHFVFAGHVPDVITATEASNAGQKSFEHLLSVLSGCSSLGDGWRTNPAPGRSRMQLVREVLASYAPAKATALFALFRKNGTWQCPTLTVLHAMAHLDEPAFRNDPRLSYLPSDVRASWEPTNDFRFKAFSPDDWEANRLSFEKQCELVARMANSGVKILAGTDTGAYGEMRADSIASPANRHHQPSPLLWVGKEYGHSTGRVSRRLGAPRRKSVGGHPQHHQDHRRLRPWPASGPGRP